MFTLNVWDMVGFPFWRETQADIFPFNKIIETLTMPGSGSPLWKSWHFVLVNRQLTLTLSNEFYFYEFYYYCYYFCTVCNSKVCNFCLLFQKKNCLKKNGKSFFWENVK